MTDNPVFAGPRHRIRRWRNYGTSMGFGVGIEFLFRDDFLTDEVAPLTSPRTAEPGPGTLNFTQTGANFSIVGSNLQIPDNTLDWGQMGYLSNESFARVAGLVAYFTTNLTTQNNIGFGWYDRATFQVGGANVVQDFEHGANFSPPAVGLGLLGDGLNLVNLLTTVVTPHELALVLRSVGAFAVAKTTNFDWTLYWVNDSAVKDPLYLALNTRDGIGESGTARISQLPSPWDTDYGIALARSTFTAPNGTLLSAITPEIGGAWTAGANWDIQANSARNTPVLGGELISNPGFEGVYVGAGTLFFAPNWNNAGMDPGDTADEELVIIHGGIKSQHIDVDAVAEGVRCDNVAVVADVWYELSVWVHPVLGSTVAMRDNLNRVNGEDISAGVGAFEQLMYIARASTTGAEAMRVRSEGGAAEFYADDASFKPFAIADLLAAVEISETDVHVIVDATIASRTQAGLVTHLDSTVAPANFILTYYNAVDNHLHVDKVVGGVYTSLVDVAAALVPGSRIYVIAFRDGANLRLRAYYNNAFIGVEQTIADAGIINNTLHGLFSTNTLNGLDNFEVFPRTITGVAERRLNEVADA